MVPESRKCFIGRAQDGERGSKVLVRAFDKAVEEAARVCGGRGGAMGIACGQIRALDGGGVMSEPTDRGIGRCCGVVALIMRRVNLGMFR